VLWRGAERSPSCVQHANRTRRARWVRRQREWRPECLCLSCCLFGPGGPEWQWFVSPYPYPGLHCCGAVVVVESGAVVVDATVVEGALATVVVVVSSTVVTVVDVSATVVFVAVLVDGSPTVVSVESVDDVLDSVTSVACTPATGEVATPVDAAQAAPPDSNAPTVAEASLSARSLPRTTSPGRERSMYRHNSRTFWSRACDSTLASRPTPSGSSALHRAGLQAPGCHHPCRSSMQRVDWGRSPVS
jgi:hypothetical protein